MLSKYILTRVLSYNCYRYPGSLSTIKGPGRDGLCIICVVEIEINDMSKLMQLYENVFQPALTAKVVDCCKAKSGSIGENYWFASDAMMR